MASSSTNSAIIGAPPATKLTRENFLSWKVQILPSLRGARVMPLLDGSDLPPSEFLVVEDENKKSVSVPNPAYDAWVIKDQQVVSFLVNSLSEEVLVHTYGLEHAAEVWRAINSLYSNQSKARVSTLRGALTNTKKLDMMAQQFITKMKGLASELEAAGKKVDDDELKDYILNGLDGSFNPLVASINAVPSTTLNNLCSQLLSYEYRENMLVATGQGSSTFTSSANAAPRRPPSPYGGAPPKPQQPPPLLPLPNPTLSSPSPYPPPPPQPYYPPQPPPYYPPQPHPYYPPQPYYHHQPPSYFQPRPPQPPYQPRPPQQQPRGRPDQGKQDQGRRPKGGAWQET